MCNLSSCEIYFTCCELFYTKHFLVPWMLNISLNNKNWRTLHEKKKSRNVKLGALIQISAVFHCVDLFAPGLWSRIEHGLWTGIEPGLWTSIESGLWPSIEPWL